MTNEKQAESAIQLQMQRLEFEMKKVTSIIPAIQELAKGSKELQEYVTNEITRFAMSVRASKLNRDELESFFNHPFHLYKEKRDKETEWHLAIPKMIDSQFGWLESQTPSHNVFLINRYVDWLGELPEALKKQVGYKDPLDVFLDGGALVGKDISKISEKYKPFISKVEKDRLIIDHSRHFELLATMIKDGILPFIPQPIPKECFVERRCEVELRDYQTEIWSTFKQYGNIGVFIPPSSGKTFIGMYTMAHIKGPHLVVVPSVLLIEQWVERIEANTDLRVGWWENASQRNHVLQELKEGKLDVIVTTYQSATKYCNNLDWSILVIDETHHLPSNEFSKLATIKKMFTLGLSATPQREDDREEFIFALTGKPVGLSWDKLKHLGVIQSPPLHVWIVKSDVQRMEKLKELMQEEKKTIIFCDSIEMGKMVSSRYNIPHVHGDTKQRLDLIKDSMCSVVSRVGDEGISLGALERVIEISWLHGSRRQELQRFTRLLHGKDTKGVGHIIMTIPEYQTDHKRLFGIMDRGFKIILHREGISEKVIQNVGEQPPKSFAKKNQKLQVTQTVQQKAEPDDFEMKNPILSLPGIQKKLNQLKLRERQFVRLLFQKEGKSLKLAQWAMLLGYKNAESLMASVNMPKLKSLELIQVDKGLYGADISLMGLK